MGLVLGLFSCVHPMRSPETSLGRELYVGTCPATVFSASPCSPTHITINGEQLDSCVLWLGRALQPATSAQHTWVA